MGVAMVTSLSIKRINDFHWASSLLHLTERIRQWENFEDTFEFVYAWPIPLKVAANFSEDGLGWFLFGLHPSSTIAPTINWLLHWSQQGANPSWLYKVVKVKYYKNTFKGHWLLMGQSLSNVHHVLYHLRRISVTFKCGSQVPSGWVCLWVWYGKFWMFQDIKHLPRLQYLHYTVHT